MILSSLVHISAECERCSSRSGRETFKSSEWMFSPWACRTTSKSRLKRARPACELEQPSSEREYLKLDNSTGEDARTPTNLIFGSSIGPERAGACRCISRFNRGKHVTAQKEG